MIRSNSDQVWKRWRMGSILRLLRFLTSRTKISLTTSLFYCGSVLKKQNLCCEGGLQLRQMKFVNGAVCSVATLHRQLCPALLYIMHPFGPLWCNRLQVESEENDSCFWMKTECPWPLLDECHKRGFGASICAILDHESQSADNPIDPTVCVS